MRMTSALRTIWIASRWFSFPASVISVFLGTVTAWFSSNTPIHYLHLTLTVIGIMAMHASANIFNDYFDFKKGVDRPGTMGSSGLLTTKQVSPDYLLKLGFVFFVSAAIIGLYLWIECGIWVLWLGLAGATIAICYTWGPALKYRALGDIAVFIAFALLISLGSFYVQTGSLSWLPVLYAIPMGLLIDGILHGNNLRDIPDDAVAGVTTLAGHLGIKGSQYYYLALIASAYASIPVLIIADHLPWPSVIVFACLPIAIRNTRIVFRSHSLPPNQFATIDAMTAQLELTFGCLLIIGIAAGRWI